MKATAFIFARGGSKGLPGKNIRPLGGKPLIAWSIEHSLAVKRIGRVIVSTDSEAFAEIARSYGAEVPFIRPKELAQDNTPTLPVLKDVIVKLDIKYDAVMTLQPTSPLRTDTHIDESIELFKNNSDADSLVSIVEVPHNFMPEKLMSYNGLYLDGDDKSKRRQDIKTIYARNGAVIYLTKIGKLNEYIFGGKILPYLMKKIDSFDIDDIEDWEIVEKLI